MRRENSEKLLPFARAMRKEPSAAEAKLWSALRNRQLNGLKFSRQLPVGPFIADLACEDAKLIVEVDGDQHESAEAYDESQTKALTALGWRVLRLYSRDVISNVSGACGVIADAAKSPHPNPLP